jgi:hypothetical protein
MTTHPPLLTAIRLQPTAYRPLPTPSDDIQQKNRHPIFGDVETRLKMTFHSPAENPRATRRFRKPLSKTPLLFFHYENVFRKKGKTISIQTDPNLIISQHEHPISKTAKPRGHNEHKEDKQSQCLVFVSFVPIVVYPERPGFQFPPRPDKDLRSHQRNNPSPLGVLCEHPFETSTKSYAANPRKRKEHHLHGIPVPCPPFPVPFTHFYSLW